MIQLMKFKDGIVEFAGRYEIYFMAAFRFVVGYVAFRLIIGNLGYMEILSDYPIALILALLCCFLPSGVMVFAAALVILLELYALSPLVCLIVAMIFLIMFCAYLRFTTRKGMYAVMTPILSVLGIPFTMPVAAGLLGEPYAVISVICGDVTYFMLKHITEDAVLFLAGGDIDTSALITLVVSELLTDQEMYLYLIGFAVAAIVTFCLCKLKINASHLLAAAFGIIIQFAIIGGGEMVLGYSSAAAVRILLGCVVSFLILMIMSFFTHSLNYARVENVQFEDDDYYYYVKAIPKSFGQWKKPGKPGEGYSRETVTVQNARNAGTMASGRKSAENNGPRMSAEEEAAAAAVRASHRKSRKRTDSEMQTEAAAQQLAVDALAQAAAAKAAEEAAARAVAERAAAAAQAISEAAGQAGYIPDGTFDFDNVSFEERLLKEAETPEEQ